jgi:hypothetical protein
MKSTLEKQYSVFETEMNLRDFRLTRLTLLKISASSVQDSLGPFLWFYSNQECQML